MDMTPPRNCKSRSYARRLRFQSSVLESRRRVLATPPRCGAAPRATAPRASVLQASQVELVRGRCLRSQNLFEDAQSGVAVAILDGRGAVSRDEQLVVTEEGVVGGE